MFSNKDKEIFKKLINSFYDLKYSINSFTNSKHELSVKNILLKYNFEEIDLSKMKKENPKKKVEYTKYLKSLQKNEFIKDLEGKYSFIHQPFGSQSFPDFIIFINGYMFHIECKSGKDIIKWNSGYPRKNSIYIFSSKKTDKTTIFFGDDSVLYEHYNDFDKRLDKVHEEVRIAGLESMEKYFGCSENGVNSKDFRKYYFDIYTRKDNNEKTKYDNSILREELYKKTLLKITNF